MPWNTPTLDAVRQTNRDYIAGRLGLQALPNGEARVLADANAGNAHLNLEYLDWQALQYLPDTAEQQFLERWANLFLVNADGTVGRKLATYSAGSVALTPTGPAGAVIAQGAQLRSGTTTYETTQDVTIGLVPTPVNIRALDPGVAGNLAPGATLSLIVGVPGVSGKATVVTLEGGAEAETIDDLRTRVLLRIRKPPMGGDADDYVSWALEYPGVTRAWCSPNEMGIGTVTVRFMMDSLRATAVDVTNGFPNGSDVSGLQAYLDAKRPVAIKDFFVVAPIPEPVGFTMQNLSPEDPSVRAAISVNVRAMLKAKASPAFALNGVGQSAQTIYAAWVSSTILQTPGVDFFDLVMADHAMPSNGSLAVLGNVY